jgi:DNA modification methylase
MTIDMILMDYEEFRKQLTHKVHERLEWKELATFVPNKALPIFNWFYYKEGFAKELVEKMIEKFELKEGSTVLDCFCGSGTTLLTCKQNNINAIGLDVLPTAVFASKVKTADYDPDLLRVQAKVLFRKKFCKLEWNFPALMKKMINKYALQDIAFFMTEIENLENKDFFTLALLSASIKVSYAWKDGGVIKIRKHPTPPLRKLFQRIVYRMISDIEKEKKSDAEITILQCDARRMSIENASVDSIITSPPYLNNIDYTKLYAIEEFFMEHNKMPMLRSYIGVRESEEKKETYFEDMTEVLEEMHRVLKKGGKASIILGNAYLNSEEIESDFITAWLAEKAGFETEEILVLNKRFALENRTEKKGVLRESLIILRKK